MQRKNNILNKSGYILIMAIVFLVIIATIMAFSMRITTQDSKMVLNTYIKNQAELYAKNAAEYALYKISKDFNSSNNPCGPRG